MATAKIEETQDVQVSSITVGKALVQIAQRIEHAESALDVFCRTYTLPMEHLAMCFERDGKVKQDALEELQAISRQNCEAGKLCQRFSSAIEAVSDSLAVLSTQVLSAARAARYDGEVQSLDVHCGDGDFLF